MRDRIDIEDLIKKKFDNHELPVRPELWDSISSQLPASASGASAVMAKAGAIKWMAAAIAIGILSTGIFLLTSEKKKESPQPSPTSSDAIAPAQDSSFVSFQEALKSDPIPSKQELSHSSIDSFPPILLDRIEESEVVSKTSYENEVSSEDKSSPAESANAMMLENYTENHPEPKIQTTLLDKESMRYLFFSNTAQAKSYAWYIDGELHSNDSNFSYAFQEGKHKIDLVVINENNSTSTTHIELETYPPISYNLPNVFSPGNDRNNDVFDVAAGINNEKEIIQLTISDKNGKVIFQSKENFIWDGRLPSGEIAPSAVYSYIILFVDKRNQPHSKGGIIQLFQE